jgi:hypothetical protein
MKTKLFLFFLLIPFYFFSNTTKNLEYKTISGFVFHKNKALGNVTVFVDNTTRYTVSDKNGFYKVKAKVGETISFSFVGLEKIKVFIEDVTSILNINLKTRNKLTQIKYNKVLKLGESSIGENIPDLFAVKIDGKSLNKNAASLIKAIQEKIPYLLVRHNDYGEEIVYVKGKELNGPVNWIIDDINYDLPFPIYLNEVKEVLVYNFLNEKSTIKVNTSIDYKKLKNIDFNNYYFTDEEFYNDDAIPYKKIKIKTPYSNKFQKVSSETEALNLYSNTYSENKNLTNYHLEVFNKFKKEKYNSSTLLKVLSDYEEVAANNPEDLKAIAYKYQELKENFKALEVYKRILKLRPNHIQSYRDLASTYLELKKYKNVWLTYNYFFKKKLKIEENDIGGIMASEINSTYNLDINNKRNIQKAKISNPNINNESDIRLVFEWNNTEAEFIIEFVNPNYEVYKIENSASNNYDLIVDQKKKGYTSKEIFIDHLNQGNYLVNFTYLGNKQYKSTILKITTYYNWGRSNQKNKIEVFDFKQKNIKTQLLKLKKRDLK